MNTIIRQLQETCAKYPEKRAVTDTSGGYSWKELEEKAAIAGTALADLFEGNRPVVLLTEKTKETLALLYGILYAGGFYVYVSPEQPKERLQKIFTDLQPAVIITDAETREIMEGIETRGVQVFKEELLTGEARRDLLQERQSTAAPEDILYAISTSGSTGIPKIVIVSHQAAADFIGHFTEIFNITEQDIIGNQAPFDFDVSIKDIFSSCRTGAELVLIPKVFFAVPKELLDYLTEHKVTVLIWAVSAMCMISGLRGFSYKIPEDLRIVMFSGETMPAKHLHIWQKALPETRFVNLYGPSEITCNCTYYEILHEVSDNEKLPIGKPFPGRTVFLLNEKEEEIHDFGTRGEICVGGESLSNGYYKRPDLTGERFRERTMPDGDKLLYYRTGDFGHYEEDDLFYFDGREDAQIKHMGHRIELGEIENAMMEIPEIDRCICLFDAENKRILGFYKGTLESAEVKNAMRKILPNYMLPNRLYRVEEFVLNKNGKIDRNVLKEMAEVKKTRKKTKGNRIGIRDEKAYRSSIKR